MTSGGFSYAPGDAVWIRPRRGSRCGIERGLARVVSTDWLPSDGTVECEQRGVTVRVHPDEIVGRCGVMDACEPGEGDGRDAGALRRWVDGLPRLGGEA